MVDGVAAFDFYDERWRDCWIAASSVARLRKKQVDFDIRQRVQKLLQDYGPQTEKSLTLRIYGTMIKGFCVINNERARALFGDCERVVLMFARQPFSEGDNKIHLPAAKRPRMEAALTLDLDLARVEANEAFDWTQAPLEEGALLRLGGGDLLQDALPPAFDLNAQADIPMLDPSVAADAAAAMQPAGEALGWLPKLEDGPPQVDVAAGGAGVPPYQELALAGEVPLQQPAEPRLEEVMPPQPPEAQAAPVEVMAEDTAKALAVPPKKRVREPLLKPGMVYGFDAEPMLKAAEYERWQQDDSELCRPHLRAGGYAARMVAANQAEHLGPLLRALVDPPAAALRDVGRAAPLALRAALAPTFHGAPPPAPELQGPVPPEAQELLAAGAGTLQPGDLPGMAPPEAAGAIVPMDVTSATPAFLEPVGASLEATFAELGQGGGGAAAAPGGPEAQDDRTAEVLTIVRGCLRAGGLQSAFFDELVPPGAADRATAACTFAALLALASAGDLGVQQGEAYGRIQISEVC